MWNRADLKANAKKIFFGNYWKAVLVTLILTIILGGATNTITRRISNNQSTDWSIDQDFSGVSSYDEWSNDEILNIGNSSLYGSEYQTYLRIYNRLKNIPGSVWAMLGIAVAVGIVVGLYNILMMGDFQDVWAVGAGAVTKLLSPDRKEGKRIDTVKNVDQYIERIDEMIERKRKYFQSMGC